MNELLNEYIKILEAKEELEEMLKDKHGVDIINNSPNDIQIYEGISLIGEVQPNRLRNTTVEVEVKYGGRTFFQLVHFK